jgi:hypothetical protein
MRIVDRMSARLTGGSLVFALVVSSCSMAIPGPQEPSSPRQEAAQANQAASASQTSPAVVPGTESLPDSPGAGKYATVVAQAGGQTDPAPPAQQPPAAAQQPPAAAQQPPAAAQQPPAAAQQPPPPQAQKPVGTAAAETTTTTGFAVSRPAGSALAPAKQKRSRTILISVAAVVGAAVAVGAVAALSKGTPSKPPGAQ